MTRVEKRKYQRDWMKSHPENVKQYKKNNKEKQKEWSRRWRESNREKCRGYTKRWKADNREKSRKIDANARLKMAYGITTVEYELLLSKQSGCCAICGKSDTEYKRRLHVDHDHLTGNIRGLLCVRCNSGLGNFQENPLLLDKAKEYIREHSIITQEKF